MESNKPLWCIVCISDTIGEAAVVGARQTKKECQDALPAYRFSDMLDGIKRRYAIVKEDELFNFGKENNNDNN